jgi:starvation-inducible outer membrane lipoprotein
MKIWFIYLLVLSLSGCLSAAANINAENTPAKKTERAAMCKKLCNKEHYNIKFIRTDGALEEYKIHIISLSDKVACECKF